MSSFASSSTNHLDDTAIWNSLKQAIASSSGFDRWCSESGEDEDLHDLSQEEMVQRYLRETLETLAY